MSHRRRNFRAKVVLVHLSQAGIEGPPIGGRTRDMGWLHGPYSHRRLACRTTVHSSDHHVVVDAMIVGAKMNHGLFIAHGVEQPLFAITQNLLRKIAEVPERPEHGNSLEKR